MEDLINRRVELRGSVLVARRAGGPKDRLDYACKDCGNRICRGNFYWEHQKPGPHQHPTKDRICVLCGSNRIQKAREQEAGKHGQ